MRLIKLTCILIPILLLTACWSKVEIDEQTFIFGIYIDKGESPGTVKVTISSPLPNRMMSGQQAGSGGNSGKPYAVVTKSDDTIPDALRNIQKDLTRRLNFGHTRIVVVSHDYAEKGINELLDWMNREPTFHLSAFLVVAPGTAKEITELVPLYEQFPAEVLRKMILQHSLLSTSVKECLIAHSSKMGFATDQLLYEVENIPSENDQTQKWTGIQGITLFRGDKFAGTLGLDESRALTWAIGKIGRQVISTTWDGGASRASILFTQLKTKKHVRMTNEGPRFDIQLIGKGDLVNFKDHEHRDAKEVNQLIEELLKKKIENDLAAAIRSSQRAKADVLRLGLLLEWNYPEEWKKYRQEWDDYYHNRIQIRASAQIDVKNNSNGT
ncbi:Spore germination protein B3 precursor [compost metagenome]